MLPLCFKSYRRISTRNGLSLRFFFLTYGDLVLNFPLFFIMLADEDSEVEYRPRRRARVEPPVTDQTDDEAYEVCSSLA